MGRYLDIAHSVDSYERNESTFGEDSKSVNEINELNEISHSPAQVEAVHDEVHQEQEHRATDSPGLCPDCGSGQWWQLPGKPWQCRACEPMHNDAARRATTLTLPCHELPAPAIEGEPK